MAILDKIPVELQGIYRIFCAACFVDMVGQRNRKNKGKLVVQEKN